MIEIIAGIEGNRSPLIREARERRIPVMVSANSYWNPKRDRFSPSWRVLEGLRVHLDSGGFVAMKRYGGFRFTPEQYITLAAQMSPVWWAQMDHCCEPEVAGDRSEVFRRIDKTAGNLRECRSLASELGASAPLMVLQGWKPSDYVSGPAFDDTAFEWPDLIGVGSVCRRSLDGPDGLVAVLRKLDAVLPAHVRFHLFGVKSQAIEKLHWHPRIASVDSMAHSYGARVVCREAKIPCTGEHRAASLVEWTTRQREAAAPPDSLF